MITVRILKSDWGSSQSNTFIGKVHGIKGKIWLGGNDVIVLPDEVVKSFLETKTPQDFWGWGCARGGQSGEAKKYFWHLAQQCGGPQLLLNRLVLCTLSTAARSRPLLYSPPLHQRGQRSQEARRAAQPLNSARVPASSSASLQKPKLCRALICSLFWLLT